MHYKSLHSSPSSLSYLECLVLTSNGPEIGDDVLSDAQDAELTVALVFW